MAENNTKFTCSNDKHEEKDSTGQVSKQLDALIRVNQSWKKAYDELQSKFETLAREYAKKEEIQKKFDALTVDYEKETRLVAELAVDISDLRLKFETVAGQYEKEKKVVVELVNENELLNTQMIAFQEGFKAERADRERMASQLDSLSERMRHLTPAPPPRPPTFVLPPNNFFYGGEVEVDHN